MIPLTIQQTLFWGLDFRIEHLQKLINLEYPQELNPSHQEITYLFTNIEESLTYAETQCKDIDVLQLRQNFEHIKKDQPNFK